MELTGLRVAVTGASGFCGAAVARAAAARGADVLCLGRRPGPLGVHRYWDATSARPNLDGAEVVIHLAAAVGDPGRGAAVAAAFQAVNVDGTARLLDAAGQRPVVWVSSASVYAPADRRGRVGEEHPVGGHHNAYGRTKAAGERLALAAGAVVLRPRAVYGPGDRHLLPRLRRAVRAGIAPLPGPDGWLSLTAVENLADACLSAPVWPAGAYNVADAVPYRRDAVVRQVLAVLGVRARVVHVPASLALAAATASQWTARWAGSRAPRLTRYAVAQLADPVVLDLAKVTARGWRPSRTLSDYLAELEPGGAAGRA